MRVLGVSAVADGDERYDASPVLGAAVPARDPASPRPTRTTIMTMRLLRRP